MVASLFAATQFFRGSSEPVADFYIATTGNDGNPGSSSSPWLTFAPLITAANAAADGAAITAYVRNGTYNDLTLDFGAAVNVGVTVTITIADGTVFDLGTKNKLQTITTSGGETGGSNATAAYAFQNFNELDIYHNSDPSPAQ